MNKNQIERYKRNILLKDFGEAGQKKLLESSVCVIGTGGLGSPVLLNLAAVGVGRLGVVDSDKVELSNLQRQIIHFTQDIGKDKTASAKEKIEKINPDIKVDVFQERFTSENALEIINDYDFIIDATDNFESKFLINDVCVKANKPFSHAGILGYQGQAMTIIPGKSACYRCVFHDIPSKDSIKTTAQLGVLGPVAGILGLIQATEAVKYLLGIGDLLLNTILTYDALKMEFRKVGVSADNRCCLIR